MNDVMRYRYPIVLWSVDVTQLTSTLPLRSSLVALNGIAPGPAMPGLARVVVMGLSLGGGAVAGLVAVRVVVGTELTLEARSLLAGDVGLVVVFGHDLHCEEHERVVLAAQLRAFALVGAELGRREVHVIALARNHVLLVQEVHDP